MAKPIYNEIATTEKDINIYAGWLTRMENPDPVLLTEASGRGLRLYDDILRDAHASSVINTRIMSVIGKEWEIIPPESPTRSGRTPSVTQEQKLADQVKNILLSCNFDQFRQELMLALLYGYYVAEVIWDNSTGQIVPSKIMGKHPRRFIFTFDRELRLLTPTNRLYGEIIPDRKFIVFTFGSSDNPYGCGLGQKLWWPVWFKKNGIKFWLVYLEKFGMPTTVGKYPNGTSAAEQQKLLDAIDAIQNESGIKIPDTMALEYLEASRTGTGDYNTMCDYMDKAISKAVLGQTLTTEIGDKGSYAASQTHNEVRQDIVKSDADLLCECLNETLIKWIADYNYPNVTDYPKIWIRCEEEQDLKQLAERDQILSNIGVKFPASYFYETYQIPQPEDGEETVGGQKLSSPDSTGQQLAGKGNNGQFAESAFIPGQNMIDDMATNATNESSGAIKTLLKPVMDKISKAKSLSEIGETLYSLYPDLNSSMFQDLLAQAMFMAGLTGYASAKDEEKE